MAISLSLVLAICLAAAVGFRLFIPFLVIGLAAKFGYITPGAHFAWLSDDGVLMVAGVLSLSEVIAYYIPSIDLKLDLALSPFALAGGVLVAAGAMSGLPHWLAWPLAFFLGGGTTAMTQGSSAMLRARVTPLSLSLTKVQFSTLEALSAALITGLALASPLVGLAAFLGIGWATCRCTNWHLETYLNENVNGWDGK